MQRHLFGKSSFSTKYIMSETLSNKNDQTPSSKKLKQAQLPFKIYSPSPGQLARSDKAQAVKKRPISRDDAAAAKSALAKRPKTSSSESECGEVSSISDEPRPASPGRQPRARLDQCVSAERPRPEVTTSCDLVDLTDDDKENRTEPGPSQENRTEPGPSQENCIEPGPSKEKRTGLETNKESKAEPHLGPSKKSQATPDPEPRKEVRADPDPKLSKDGRTEVDPETITKSKVEPEPEASEGNLVGLEPGKENRVEPEPEVGFPASEAPELVAAQAGDADETAAGARRKPADDSGDKPIGLDDDAERNDGVSAEAASKGSGLASSPEARTSLAKKTPKQKEREMIRARREKEKQEEKQRREEEKERIRKEKQEQREKERKEKEEKKEKERQEREKEKLEKQKQKEADRLQKEAERQKREDEKKRLKDEEKRQKEQEKQAKEEEKRKAEEEERRKLEKAKSMFSSFFVKKSKEPEADQEAAKEEENKAFQEFRVKEDMVLAPGARTELSRRQCSDLEAAVAAPAAPPPGQLYVAELRAGRRRPQRRGRTLPPLQKEVEIVEDDEDEDKELDGLGTDIVLSSAAASRRLRYKLLMFHENRRPAYWGTWSKRSERVTARRPLGKDQNLNYEEDSDDDWEEEDPNGESLSGSEKEVESEDEYEVDNEFFVPHGYLSDEEVKDKEEIVSPETQKAKLKAKGEEFEKQMKKKTTALKPRLIGCVWQDDTNMDPMYQQLLKLLRPFAVRPLTELPVPVAAAGGSGGGGGGGGEVAGSESADPSPATTPASAQAGCKFLKKFPDEALLPLAQLVHGSTRGKPLLVREFAAFWKRRAGALSPRKPEPAGGVSPRSRHTAGTPTGAAGPLLSKRKIEDKLTEIATYARCPTEGPLFNRCCWQVNAEVLAALPAALPLPSQWKWVTKTGVKRASPAAAENPAAAAENPVPRPRAGVALITKFAKVVSSEEARRQLLSPPAKRKIVPTQLSAPEAAAAGGQPSPQGITRFFKASPAAAAGSGAAADAGIPRRRLAPTALGSGASPAATGAPKRRLGSTPVAVGAGSAAGPVRRLAPTPVAGPSAAGRKVALVPVPREAPPAGAAVEGASAAAAGSRRSVAGPAPAAGTGTAETKAAAASVETITLD